MKERLRSGNDRAEVRIEMRHGVAVAVPVKPVAAGTTEEVVALRRRIREEREDRLRSSDGV